MQPESPAPASSEPASNYAAPAPAVSPPSDYGTSDLAQLIAGPLPETGIKVNTPVQSFIAERAVPEAKTIDEDNYDPFTFQGLEELANPGSDVSANLENEKSNTLLLAGGENDLPEANRNNEANQFNTGILQGKLN